MPDTAKHGILTKTLRATKARVIFFYIRHETANLAFCYKNLVSHFLGMPTRRKGTCPQL